MKQNIHKSVSMSSITRNSVKMVAEPRNDAALWIFDNPRLDSVFGECNMTGVQQAATSTASGAHAPPFTAEQQGFLEEFMRVQHLNHEAAIHQLQISHAEELQIIRQESEDARRTEHMRSRMDLKVGKPDVWNSDKTPFLEWDHRWRVYMGMCSTAIFSDIQNIRENPKRIVIYSNLELTRHQASNEVYFSLVMLTTCKAATIVRTVRDNNGYEAYRLLRQRFDPENYGKHLSSLTQILKFDFGSNPSDFLDKLIEWEGLIDKYEQETLKTISENLLSAIVVEKAPEAIKMHLLVQCGERPDWPKLRQTVHDYCYSVISGPIPMDVEPSPRAGERASARTRTSHTAMASRARRARRASRRRLRRNPRSTISSTVTVGVAESGDTCRKTVVTTRRINRSTMFSRLDRQHQAQHLSRHSSSSSAPPQAASMQGAIVFSGLEEDEDG